MGKPTSIGCNASNSTNGRSLQPGSGTIRPIPIGNGPEVQRSATAQYANEMRRSTVVGFEQISYFQSLRRNMSRRPKIKSLVTHLKRGATVEVVVLVGKEFVRADIRLENVDI